MYDYITENAKNDIIEESRETVKRYKIHMKNYKSFMKENNKKDAITELKRAKLDLLETKKKIEDLPLNIGDNICSAFYEILKTIAITTVAQGAIYGLTKGSEKYCDTQQKKFRAPGKNGTTYYADVMLANNLEKNKQALNKISNSTKITKKSVAITIGSAVGIEGIKYAYNHVKNAKTPQESVKTSNIFKKKACEYIDGNIKKIDKLITFLN